MDLVYINKWWSTQKGRLFFVYSICLKTYLGVNLSCKKIICNKVYVYTVNIERSRFTILLVVIFLSFYRDFPVKITFNISINNSSCGRVLFSPLFKWNFFSCHIYNNKQKPPSFFSCRKLCLQNLFLFRV